MDKNLVEDKNNIVIEDDIIIQIYGVFSKLYHQYVNYN
jgi:hypothetical protein